MKTVEERFWAKVNKDGPLFRGAPCWLWLGIRLPIGYGRMYKDNRRVRAHRIAYELLIGPIPEGLELDHLCRNHSCVNPRHLEPVTHKENCLRGLAPIMGGDLQRAKTHCAKGHPYDAANTYFNPRNRKRGCRTCNRAAAKHLYYAKAQQREE